MDKNTILESMEHIDPKLIEDADCGVKSGRSVFNKSMLIAACVCLLLITTALAAGVFFSTPEVEYRHRVNEDTGEMRHGFKPTLNQQTDAETDSTKVPLECFNEAFLADVANDEFFAGYYFDAWSDMEEYIGFNVLDNPVLNDAIPEEFAVNDIWTHGYMSCVESDGIPDRIEAQASFDMNYTDVPSSVLPWIINSVPVTVTLQAIVYTEHSLIGVENLFPGIYFEDGTEITDELYTSPGGHSFRIIRAELPDDKAVIFYGLACINNAYISVQSIFYNDEAVALSTLKEVLDGFVIG